MWLGTMKHSRSKILEFKSTKDQIKVLGMFLSYNQNKNVEQNFVNRIRKMKTKLNLWLSRDLTLYGKSLLANTLGVSQLVNAELFNFLWKNKKDKIKTLVMYQPLAEGGFNFVNFPVVVKSLRLTWISRFFSNSRDSWKAIPNHYLSTHGGLQFLSNVTIMLPVSTIIYILSIGSFYSIFKSSRTRLKYSRVQ